MLKTCLRWIRIFPRILPLVWAGLFSCALVFKPVATQAAVSVNLAWDANSDPDIAGYKVHFGTSSGNYSATIDAANTTTATVSNLTGGTIYFFVVTASNTAGLESLPSNEVAFTASSLAVALTAPTNGESFNGPARIALGATASVTVGSVAKVEFYDGLVKLGESTSPPYTMVWNDAPLGYHRLVAIASDGTTASLTSGTVSINVVQAGISIMQAAINPLTGQRDLQLTLTGAPGRMNSIFVSADLQSWTLLSRVLNTTGTLVVPDPAAAKAKQRFYRISPE